MKNIISISGLNKKYSNDFQALTDINLEIKEGEIFALLGPNGAGKTTLIGIISGITQKTSGDVTVLSKDIIADYRFTRSVIGLVPQEIALDIFLPVQKTLEYQRGFYGKPANPVLVEKTLKQLSLWDKRDNAVQELSGGMKRRVLIGKALMNEPKILFLDEPTAGVDVELRKDMWNIVRELKAQGTTIILTTHYIEEAEEMADRIGIINDGKLDIVEEKAKLMEKFGTKTMRITLSDKLETLPAEIANQGVTLNDDKKTLVLTYTKNTQTGIASLFAALKKDGIAVHDIDTQKSSLEEIFISLLK